MTSTQPRLAPAQEDAVADTAADTGTVTVSVDGVVHALAPPVQTQPLLTVLREEWGVTAPKEGCGTGVCGACTVLVDGRPVTSCTMLAGDADGCAVLTSGAVAAGAGADVARCLVAAGGIQCGFCSPGFVVAITALLERDPGVNDAAARLSLAGNLCRCTGYGRILAAVQMVQDERAGRPPTAS